MLDCNLSFWFLTKAKIMVKMDCSALRAQIGWKKAVIPDFRKENSENFTTHKLNHIFLKGGYVDAPILNLDIKIILQ